MPTPKEVAALRDVDPVADLDDKMSGLLGAQAVPQCLSEADHHTMDEADLAALTSYVDQLAQAHDLLSRTLNPQAG